MKGYQKFNQKGITLIELMVALIISGITIAGIYNLFRMQSRAYTVQDQVVEVQQGIRSAMEILLRDLRMAGFDDDATPAITILNPVAYPLSENSIIVSYEYFNRNLAQYEIHTVTYNLNNSNLIRQSTVDNVAEPPEILLPNINLLIFSYGVDQDNDGIMDDQNGNGFIDNNDWLSALDAGTRKVVAIRVTLAAIPNLPFEELQESMSPRTLTSAITLRNLSRVN